MRRRLFLRSGSAWTLLSLAHGGAALLALALAVSSASRAVGSLRATLADPLSFYERFLVNRAPARGSSLCLSRAAAACYCTSASAGADGQAGGAVGRECGVGPGNPTCDFDLGACATSCASVLAATGSCAASVLAYDCACGADCVGSLFVANRTLQTPARTLALVGSGGLPWVPAPPACPRLCARTSPRRLPSPPPYLPPSALRAGLDSLPATPTT
jgi:hypothetical protein